MTKNIIENSTQDSTQNNLQGDAQAPKREYIKLDQFLKLAQVVHTGGEAKQLILSGFVDVNGEPELRRGRKLYHGDVVVVEEDEMTVMIEDE